MVDAPRSRTPPASGPGPPPRPSSIGVVIDGPIAAADVPGLWERVRALRGDSGAELVVCDVAALIDPDVVTVDALARLQLEARRSGCRIRLRHACRELRELLVLMGLADVVPECAGLPFEPEGQAEQREQPLGVEEEADPGDATA